MSILISKDPKIVFFGMPSSLSAATLEAVLKSGCHVQAIVLQTGGSGNKNAYWLPKIPPPSTGSLRILPNTPRSIGQLASEFQVPVLSVPKLQNEWAMNEISLLTPDLFFVSCFPSIFTERWLEIPKSASLNLHPSLLPGYRGPHPLFWQLRHRETAIGVTIHIIDSGIDSGPIVDQLEIPLNNYLESAEINALIGQAGGILFRKLIAKGKLIPKPQRSKEASYFGRPTEADRCLNQSWSVEEAYRFLKGANDWLPIHLALDSGEKRLIHKALGILPGKRQSQPIHEQTDGFTAQLSNGLLCFK